ncbi:murein transglycosylase A [Parazoarcus communis]|uniref:murein transglycosylase A n=1 Tax=Parazoarcus communis TaxID=41977 RepID=UPI001F39EBBF|nr:murein transglycosylase A [Parazoarcus communis]
MPPQAPPAGQTGAMSMATWAQLPGWAEDDHAAAWPAFRESCGTLSRRNDWKAVCALGARLPASPSTNQVKAFFEQHFTPWRSQNADGSDTGLVTGYYEPLIKGSRVRSAQSRWPIHAPPDDMLTIDLASVYPELKSLRLRGRLVGNKVVPYWTRAELEQRQELLAPKILLWADDPIDLFFLQVQGSGRVELPDGSRLRIGYADQNGHPYQSIGRWLVSQGELSLDKASMEGIRQWARDNPARLGELLNSNPSYVFFRELPASTSGPIGALGVPITEERSIAIDPAYIPLGAPVFLATTWPYSNRTLNRLVLAQDTGSAIKGPVRADYFWGFGAQAGTQAGKMRQNGRIWVLLPNGVKPANALGKG